MLWSALTQHAGTLCARASPGCPGQAPCSHAPAFCWVIRDSLPVSLAWRGLRIVISSRGCSKAGIPKYCVLLYLCSPVLGQQSPSSWWPWQSGAGGADLEGTEVLLKTWHPCNSAAGWGSVISDWFLCGPMDVENAHRASSSSMVCCAVSPRENPICKL